MISACRSQRRCRATKQAATWHWGSARAGRRKRPRPPRWANLVQFEASKRLQTAGGPLDLVTLARTGSLDDFPFLVPDAGAPVQRPSRGSTEDLVEGLADQGLAAFAVDLSRGPWSVVRVIVPGLRPLWPRFAPGRLSDVPHRLGWTAEPTPEASFNPVPILY
jgi:hypothetical protein